MPEYRYAGYPSAKLYQTKGGSKQIHHLLWGDWIRLEGGEEDGWIPVHVRGEDGWMRTTDLQTDRLLEIVFTDVGQGDGALLVTPSDRHIVIDAGIGDNMYRYLKWRYGGFKSHWNFEAAVLTHPDQDHYYGFSRLFEEPNVSFDTVYHNGIMEERGEAPLGPSTTSAGINYLTHIVEDRTRLQAFLADEPRWRHPASRAWDKRYASLLNTAETGGRVGDIRMLSVLHSERHDGRGYMPGYGPEKDLSIEVLGPYDEPDNAGRARLRWFRERPDGGSLDEGKTKNGHSVLLKLRYGDVSVLFGGDLNLSSEMYLLMKHAGVADLPRSGKEEQQLVDMARPVFRADVAKCCHHGSADFSNLFLQAVDCLATVISSGDQEPYAHPRSDTLGAIGLYGRGWRPLIFSTELMRSTREREPVEIGIRIGQLRARRDGETDPATRATIQAQMDELVDLLMERNVTVYGAINLRTDGQRVVMAYMLEQPRRYGNAMAKWDIYALEKQGNGPLMYVG